LLRYAGERKLDVRLLAACNSGDTAGDKDRVVGYSSFGLYAQTESEAGAELLRLARRAIEDRLFGNSQAAAPAAWLRQPGASFVTLLKDGELRGCIGSLEAARPLALDVAGNAFAAAFRDPRFPALAADEWPQCEVEVSLLSSPRRLAFADEAGLLSAIEAGVDGLILEADGRRATFLPQVWERVPDKRAFLDELKRKAGIAPQTPLERCAISRYRVVKFHGR
jgi:AmmeMemoRadiSam system protein A